MNIKEYKQKAELIRDTDVYKVYDLKTLDNLTLSLTELNPNNNTSGHSHDDADEVYVFLSGHGIIQVDDTPTDVKSGDVVTVPRGTFHKVYNNSATEVLSFWAIFEKYEDRK